MQRRQADVRRAVAARAALVAVAVIVTDQVTKHTLGTWIQPGQVRHLVPGLTFVYERNTGVAFSFLAGSGVLVYVIIAAVVVALGVLLAARPEKRLIWLPTGLLAGGAVSNVIDRVTLGSVIDFIKLPHWPAFNLADTSITFGAVILALVFELSPRGNAE